MKTANRPGAGFLLGAAASMVLLSTLSTPARAHLDHMDPPMAYGRVPSNLYAYREPYIFTHNVGLLTLQITNVGIIGNPFIDDLSAGWRGGEYLYVSALWIGAIGSDAEPHVSTGAYQIELRPELDPRWTIYESFEGVKGGYRLGAADPKAADDDNDGLYDEDFQDGLDNDGDNLIDEDYAAIGQQMFSCVYKDDTPEAVAQNTEHKPLNITVQQRSFQWSTAEINEFVGFEFNVINHGDQRLKNVYLSFFSDSDAGPKTADRYWTDDLVGWAEIDTTITDETKEGSCSIFDLEIQTAYMWDAPDNGTSIVGGDVPGVFGSLFLGHTIDDAGIKAPQRVGLHSVAWFSSTGANSDPQNDDERYTLISSGVKPNRNATKPDDYRYIISAGPFAQLNPGESLTFQTAYVIGDHQNGFRHNAVAAQRVFNGRYIDADKDPSTGVDGMERCLIALEPGQEIIYDSPCDTIINQIHIKNSQSCTWVDDDCNPCTGIKGEETHIEWVGTTAPPPPNMNTNPELDPLVNPDLKAFVSPAGDKEVLIQWDNASELRKDPITGENLFEGYRIWRVDNWQRPEGSIGPSPEEWMLIGEFRLKPKDNTCYPCSQHYLGRVQQDVEPLRRTDDGSAYVYPIGRYQYVDQDGIINGKVIFYSVTAFGVTKVKNPITGENEEVELSGQPAAIEAEVVVPRWNAQDQLNCDNVNVVPNPYRSGAEWDLVPSERDPTGTKIAFTNLPKDVSTIRIYTMAGDLVQSASHDGRSGDGTYFWNLITRNGQNVVSGAYLYSVESPEGICRGRFVIIR